MNKIKSLIKLMRPKHYIKNLLIFVSIFFDRNIFAGSILAKVICGFVAFCVISSAIYIFNDIHPTQKYHDGKLLHNEQQLSFAIWSIHPPTPVLALFYICPLDRARLNGQCL